MVDEVNKLKTQKGKDIIVYGGTAFVSELIGAGLIDDIYLFFNPVALGKRGVPIFNKLDGFQQFKLKKSFTYNCGIVLLNYLLTKKPSVYLHDFSVYFFFYKPQIG